MSTENLESLASRIVYQVQKATDATLEPFASKVAALERALAEQTKRVDMLLQKQSSISKEVSHLVKRAITAK